MKSISLKSLLLGTLLVSTSMFNTGCIGDYIENYTGNGTKNDEPNVPDTYQGRPVDVQGTLYVNNKNVTFYVWDSGMIDGDIISLTVNGKELTQIRQLKNSIDEFGFKEKNILLFKQKVLLLNRKTKSKQVCFAQQPYET